MLRAKFRKPELIPLLFILCATIILCSLGVWQTQRLFWKQNLLATIEQAGGHAALGTLPQDTEGLTYRHVLLQGTFLHGHTLNLVGRHEGERSGYFMLTPFTLEDDGRIILVNRGFSPPEKASQPEGLQSVDGIIRPARQKRFFSPANDSTRNIWFYEDFPAMEVATGLTLTPIIVEATGTKEHGIYPIPSNGVVTVRNDHLAYAITWFTLAGVGLIMFAIYHRAREET